MNRLAEYLDHCADDVKERYQKALKVVGKDNFTYIKVELDNFEEVTKMAVISGFENLPKKYQEDVKSEEWFKYGIVPYMLIEQNNQLNWLVVKSNADYETQDSDRVDKLTLPRVIGDEEFWADAYVLNSNHLDYGYENGGINIVADKKGFVRIK